MLTRCLMFPTYARWMAYIYVTCKTVGVRLLKLKDLDD